MNPVVREAAIADTVTEELIDTVNSFSQIQSEQ